MKKLSINVIVPAVGDEMEFQIPEVMRVDTALRLISRIIVDTYPGINVAPAQLTLVRLSDLHALRHDCSFAQMDILDGTRMLLM